MSGVEDLVRGWLSVQPVVPPVVGSLLRIIPPTGGGIRAILRTV